MLSDTTAIKILFAIIGWIFLASWIGMLGFPIGIIGGWLLGGWLAPGIIKKIGKD